MRERARSRIAQASLVLARTMPSRGRPVATTLSVFYELERRGLAEQNFVPCRFADPEMARGLAAAGAASRGRLGWSRTAARPSCAMSDAQQENRAEWKAHFVALLKPHLKGGDDERSSAIAAVLMTLEAAHNQGLREAASFCRQVATTTHRRCEVAKALARRPKRRRSENLSCCG